MLVFLRDEAILAQFGSNKGVPCDMVTSGSLRNVRTIEYREEIPRSGEDAQMPIRIKASVTLIALSLLALSCDSKGTAAAQGGFSLASIHGSYAGIFEGKINTSGGLLEFLGTGIFVADGKGNFTGTETYTVVSTPCVATVSGTYTVNPDGSGTNTASFTTTSPGCSSGIYTQTLAIGQSGHLVLLSNTNGDQVNEEWHLQ